MRDAARSREAILDAAEQLFAVGGYDATSLEAIGHLAGVSRGTPRYFFGAKESLYKAVLTRVLTAESELLISAYERAVAVGGNTEKVVTELVDTFFDFLVARPTFVQLVEREAASGKTLREVAVESPIVQQGLGVLGTYFASGPIRSREPAFILLSVIALCWFPLSHAETFTRGLGLEPESREFQSAWKRHVVALLLGGIGRDERES